MYVQPSPSQKILFDGVRSRISASPEDKEEIPAIIWICNKPCEATRSRPPSESDHFTVDGVVPVGEGCVVEPIRGVIVDRVNEEVSRVG